MKAVYFFCTDHHRDKVAPAAFAAYQRLLSPVPAEFKFGGRDVLEHRDAAGNTYFLVPTDDVLSHVFDRQLAELNDRFAGVDLAGIVNWHEGNNAPDRIFCAHTNGDVPSGIYPPADPVLTRAVLLAMNKSRMAAGLTDWSVLPEATHFSGVQYGVDPAQLQKFPAPVVDIEIGSSGSSWSNQMAVDAMAAGLAQVFDFADSSVPSALFVGGLHFEPSLKEAVFTEGGAFSFSHVLANQWVATAAYDDQDGLEKLRRAAKSVKGGVQVVAFHDNLKGSFKAIARSLASELGVPAVNHRRLRSGQTAVMA